MTNAPRTPCAERLMWMLVELGYSNGQGIQFSRLAGDINRRARGNFTQDSLKSILYRGREIDCGELLTICEGLDIDPEEILYGEEGRPAKRRRPKGKRLMDVIEDPL